MRKLLVLLLFVPSLAFGWSNADTAREAVYLGFHIADWGQTLHIAESNQFYETNPVLGKHPSRGKVNRYFAVTAVSHVAVSYILSPNCRQTWQYITIGVEAGYISNNYNAGVSFGF